MKNLFFLIIISFFFIGKTFAQPFVNLSPADSFVPIPFVPNNFPLSNYHFFNPSYYNPAMVGIEDKKQLNAIWNRGADHSFFVNYEQPIKAINSAIGLHFSHTSTFSRSIRKYGLAYNYGFKVDDNAQLKLGVRFSNVHVGLGRYYEDVKDWYSVPALDIGLAFQVKQLRVGFSVQNLFPTQIVSADNSLYFADIVNGERQLNISIANTFKLSEKWDWSIANLFRIGEDREYYYEDYTSNIHDLSSYISFRKTFFIGATFRTKIEHHWIGFVGVKIKEKINLQFSFNEQKIDYEDKRIIEVLAQYQF